MMKHRAVVANFIFKTSEDEDSQTLVALFRRSSHPNVRSYQDKLAPISGSIDEIDANPLEAAARELREETRLDADTDLALHFTGKTFSFVDNIAQRSWTVHPFGWFLITDESKIEINWEHSEWEWIQPGEVLNGNLRDECVPRIQQSLKRVYFGNGGMFPGERPLISSTTAAGRSFLSTLERLKNDKESGARVLATEAVKGLKEIATDLKTESNDPDFKFNWLPSIRIATFHIIYSGRPNMNAAIKSAVLQAFQTDAFDHTNNITLDRMIKKLDDIITQRQKMSREISESFKEFVRSASLVTNNKSRIRIFTVSSSSTINAAILHALQRLPELEIDLIIFESRPLCEGASFAANLIKTVSLTHSEPRLHITVAPESHMAYLLQKHSLGGLEPGQIVLIGADRITPSGHVSNKMGSASLAAIAKSITPTVSVVVLSEADKISTPSNISQYEQGKADIAKELIEQSVESGHRSEIYGIWSTAGTPRDVPHVLTSSNMVDIQNVYFEFVNCRWIDEYVCEEGTLKKDNIMAKSLKLARLEKKTFSDLYED